MKKILTIALMGLTLSACAEPVSSSPYSRTNVPGVGQICVDGVQYLYRNSSLTVKYDREGNVVQC